MNIAVIPWSDMFLQDKMFDVADPNVNFDGRLEPYEQMQKVFLQRGDQFHTIDYYTELSKVDYFLFLEQHSEWLKKLTKLKLNHRLVYCNAEPPTVNMLNMPEGYRKLGRYFPYIMTWNLEWVDNKTIFKKNIPYVFKENIGNIPFAERKLLTSISGNKKSDYPDELYSERERVITFFEQNYPEEFDFYGTGWDASKHSAYKGKVDVKAEVFHKYRFALAFENTRGVKGYVTEKVLDCLTAGVVPVYAGAEDISSYIPEESFVRYERFKDYQELADYLFGVTEKEYEAYLEAAQRFLHSDAIKQFSGERYAEDVYSLIAKANKKNFHVKKADYLRLSLKIWKSQITSRIKRTVKCLLGKK